MKFKTFYDRPESLPSDPGQEIYKWEYLNDKGELVEDEMNIFEKIQSYSTITDYKEQIRNGEFMEDNSRGVFMDSTRLGDDSEDVNDFYRRIALAVKAIENINKQDDKNKSRENKSKTIEDRGENKKRASEASEEEGGEER